MHLGQRKNEIFNQNSPDVVLLDQILPHVGLREIYKGTGTMYTGTEQSYF